MGNEELQSKVIDFLRFPLIVVVFIHNYNLCSSSFSNMPLYYVVSELLSQVVGQIAVPTFFFISGFLFFLTSGTFTVKAYIYKLRSRWHTLLIPYVFWNLAFLSFYYVAPKLSLFFKGTEYSWDYILSALWGQMNETGTMTYPIVYQFWFIRDLMVVVVLSPFIFCFLKNLKLFGVIIVGLLWYVGYEIPYLGIRGFSLHVFFFFMLGAWFSINKKNVIELLDKLGGWIFVAYPLLATVDLLSQGNSCNKYIHNLGVFIGVIFCFALTKMLLRSGRIKLFPFLSSASFFVFAIHEPWLLSLSKKVLFYHFYPDGDVFLTLLYFGIVFLTVIAALGIYYVLQKSLPKFTSVITGGR